jgi:hypothetical protein
MLTRHAPTDSMTKTPIPRAGPLPARAYHLVDAENWPSIQQSGLLSTTRLIARDGLRGVRAEPFLDYRAETMRLPSGAVIRDQRPMPPEALMRCLDPGLTPQAWYALVNAKVFFWLQPERLDRHLAACGARPQIVLSVDLQALLARHGRRAFVTPFNIGNARRRPAPRGARSFVPVGRWLDSRWQGEARDGEPPRAASHPPAELAIEGAVPDVMEMVVAVRPVAAGAKARPGKEQPWN